MPGGGVHSRGRHKYQSQRTIYDPEGQGHEIIAYQMNGYAVVKWKVGTTGTGSAKIILTGLANLDEAKKEMLKLVAGKLKQGWTITRSKSTKSSSQAQSNLAQFLKP